MNGFVAIILVCLNSTPTEGCTEDTAADVMSTVVNSELGCTTGWQEVVGRSALRDDIGKTAYVKTICRRDLPDTRRSGRKDGIGG
jgi:hypothetical protein